MKVGYLITGRLKSTRLPKKLLLEIKGKTVIEHMIDRLKLAIQVHEIIICTSGHDQDKPLIDIAKQNKVKSYTGDPDDVLSRLLGAADHFGLDYILNITADCPFADPGYADKIVEEFNNTNADLIRQFDLPHGVFSYGIKVDALRKVVSIKDSNDTEVWGRYFVDTGMFDVLDLDVENSHHNRPGLRMTLDYQEDFDFFKTIFDELYVEDKVFSLDDILNLLDRKPEIININKHCSDKFKKRFVSQSEPKLKKVKKVHSALIVGAGSIGQRHIKNLIKIGINNIIALRSRRGHHKNLPKEFNVVEVTSWDEALLAKPDIAIISNPSSLHVESAKKVIGHVKGVFIEKPISSSINESQELVKLFYENKTTSFVGYNMMFHPVVRSIIKFYNENDVGEVVNIQCQVGQWLPDWHPYEDYKNAYYARKDLGGGVALTLIHEIHLALELAGRPQSVFGEVSTYEKLTLEVDVCSDLMIKHQTGAVSQIHLDYLQQPPHRSGLITFEMGWISYDFTKMEVVGQIKGDKAPRIIWSDKDYDYNQPYVDQLLEFVRFTREGRLKHEYDAESAIASLGVVDSFFKSNDSGKRTEVELNKKFSF